MESLTSMKTWIFATIATVGSVITGLLGGWDKALETLLLFMVIDYVLGLIVAGVYKKSTKSESGGLNSMAGWKGIIKKILTLLLVLVADQLDTLLAVDYIRDGLIYALIIDEGISIAELYGLTGNKMPDILIKALDVLQTRKEKTEPKG